MQAVRAGLELARKVGVALLILGIVIGLLSNIRVGAITMGIGLGTRTIAEIMAEGERRRLQLILPLIIAVALVTVALALPQSSA